MDSVVIVVTNVRSKIRNFKDQRAKKQGNKGTAKKLWNACMYLQIRIQVDINKETAKKL